ncbi:MAG: hypothetical protein HRU20_32195, partial [Pseudomonadales bacterium]|nr:hypothetical protein [Pseudomonadales bacterium]
MKNFYTYGEASKAAMALGITTSRAYKKRYNEDPKLPSTPKSSYKDDWENWPVFLDGEIKEFYTYGEASKAAMALGITTYTEYKKRYKEDPKLPSTPEYSYKDDWENWPVFLGTK